LPILLNFLSIPAAPGPATEFLRLPHFHGEKTRAAPEYSQVGKGTQVKMLENWAKMKIFLWHCGFSGQKQRFFGRPPPDFWPFRVLALAMAQIWLISAPLQGLASRLSASRRRPLLKKVWRTMPDRWSSMVFGRISSHDTKFM